MKCRLSILRRSRTKNPWWKITRKPWSKFSPMAMDAMCSNMASTVTNQGFQMACLTLLTHFLWSFLRIWGAPQPQHPSRPRLWRFTWRKGRKTRWRAPSQRSWADYFAHISFGLFFWRFCKVRCFAIRMHTIPYNPWPFLAHCTGSCFNEKTFS